MKKTIIILGILIIASATAMTCDIDFSGESCSFPINFTNPVYTVYNNASNLDGLTVDFENGNITVSTVVNFAPDNFTLLFFDEVTREVIKEVGSHCSGSSTRYVDRNVTVYVPEYVNNTETIYLDGDSERIIEIETGYKLRHIVVSCIVGLLIALLGLVIYKIRKTKDE